MARCTPRCIRTDERLELDISEEDRSLMGRGRPWSAVVTDRSTGRRFALWDATCGLPNCHCDAQCVELPL